MGRDSAEARARATIGQFVAWRGRPRHLAGAFAVVWAGAMVRCSGPGNTGQVAVDPALIAAVPWTNGVLPRADGGQVVVPSFPVFPPIATGLVDPGSGPVDCTAAQAVTPSPYWVETFEPADPTDPTQVGVGAAWAAFDDFSSDAFHVPGDATWYPGLNGAFSAPWGLPADTAGGPSCDGTPNHYSLHFRGGLFRKWGGGVTHVFTDPNGCPAGADFCPPPPAAGATVDSVGLPLTAPDGGPYAQSHAFLDVSAYDGVAFWARRGPEGQQNMIVTITDNFTSDRLARQNQKYCRRLSPISTGNVCRPQCVSGVPCVPDDPTSATPVYRCMDPAGTALPDNTSLAEFLYPRCGASACSSPDTNPDPDFDGKQCRPYTFPAADESADYCFNPGDPPPPARDERCLDGWATSVILTLDWQYYVLPFTSMLQGGFGKTAPYFNLHAVDTIAFGFIVGWADAYIDNVTFYRQKK